MLRARSTKIYEVQLDDTIACWQKQYQIKWIWTQQQHTGMESEREREGKKITWNIHEKCTYRKININENNEVEKQTYEKYVFETTFRITHIIVRSIIQRITNPLQFGWCVCVSFFSSLARVCVCVIVCAHNNEVQINTYQHILFKLWLILDHNSN